MIRDTIPGMSSGSSALSAVGVGVRRKGGRWLFRDLSLDLQGGEIVRLMGPPGSGVSALLQVFAGLIAPTRGTIRRRAPSVGFVPRHFPETLQLSAIEYLTWIGRIRGMRPEIREQRVNELIRSFELGSSAGIRVASVAGTRTELANRLAVMQALLDEPSLLILDDPWKSTDGHLRDLLDRQIVELAAAGCLIVYRGTAPALHPTRYLSLIGGRLRSTWHDPESDGDLQMRVELTGKGADLTGLPGVIEEHVRPDGVLVIVEREHSDDLIAWALQSGWSIHRIGPAG